MIVGVLQTASSGEALGTPRPANDDAKPAGLQGQQPTPDVSAQFDGPSPAQPSQFTLAYHVDENTRQVYFQIVDSESGQVIRQVPPAEELALESHIAQLMEVAENAKQPRSQGGGH
jgi:hypothetical protein